MDCHRLLLVDMRLVALAAACRVAPLDRDDYLQSMREALCVLCSGWGGSDEELVTACQAHAERERWREQHTLRRRADLADDLTPAPPPTRSRKAAELQRGRDYGGTGTHTPYTLDLADIESLTTQEWQAVVSNLLQRNIINGATAHALLIEVTRLPAWAQPIARAVLCSFSMAELRQAGYSRNRVETVRDMLSRLGMTYHLQTT